MFVLTLTLTFDLCQWYHWTRWGSYSTIITCNMVAIGQYMSKLCSVKGLRTHKYPHHSPSGSTFGHLHQHDNMMVLWWTCDLRSFTSHLLHLVITAGSPGLVITAGSPGLVITAGSPGLTDLYVHWMVCWWRDPAVALHCIALGFENNLSIKTQDAKKRVRNQQATKLFYVGDLK
jgi:hypothetical protein